MKTAGAKKDVLLIVKLEKPYKSFRKWCEVRAIQMPEMCVRLHRTKNAVTPRHPGLTGIYRIILSDKARRSKPIVLQNT